MKKILSSSSCKILVILALLLLGSSLAKAQSFSVDYNAVKLSYALSDIQKKSGYNFVYNNSLVNVNALVTAKRAEPSGRCSTPCCPGSP